MKQFLVVWLEPEYKQEIKKVAGMAKFSLNAGYTEDDRAEIKILNVGKFHRIDSHHLILRLK